tara:strand:+ start:1023 stop:1712 length:690 start_codon:yes stop_codon:yes gene_type:complete
MGQKTAAFLKTQNRDFNNVIDSALNLVDGGTVAGALTCTAASTFSGGMTSNYLDFATGNISNLQGTVVAITDAEADAGVGGNAAAILAATLNAGALNTLAHDTGAAGAVYLPICAQDTHTAVHITGDMDEANACTFFARGAVGAGTDVVFAKQTITFNGKGGIGVITSGTPATPTAIKLAYTPAAADTNALGAGSVIHFYAPVANRWVVRIDSIAEGTGATGTLTTATS